MPISQNSYLLEVNPRRPAGAGGDDPAAAITNGGIIQANNAELDINGEAVANTGTLAAINGGTLKLISTTVTNSGSAHGVGRVRLDARSCWRDHQRRHCDDFGHAGVDRYERHRQWRHHQQRHDHRHQRYADDRSPVLHTITNHNLIQASGGELDISGDLIVNTANIKAINAGTLKLTTVTVTNTGGTITVDGTSKLYLSDVTVNDGSLNNSGNLYGVSGANIVSAAVANNGTIEVQAGTLNLAGGLTGGGSVTIDNGATLELAGANAQTITFAGGTDTLQLDKVVGQSFTGTIAGQSTKAGTSHDQGHGRHHDIERRCARLHRVGRHRLPRPPTSSSRPPVH